MLTSITFDSTIGSSLNFFQKILKVLFSISLKFHNDQTSRRLCNEAKKLLYEKYIIFLVSLELFFLFYLKLFVIFSAYLRLFT